MRSTKNQQLFITLMFSAVILCCLLFVLIFFPDGMIIALFFIPCFLVPAVIFGVRFFKVKYYEKHSVPVLGRIVRIYRKSWKYYKVAYFTIEFKISYNDKPIIAKILYSVQAHDMYDLDMTNAMELRYIESKNLVIVL